jgi:hypothetical protein
LDVSKMKSLGWEAHLSSNRAVERACRELAEEIQ